MKKFIYLCGMILLSMNVMAQIDLNDGNWERVFYDDFTTNTWDNLNNWKITHPEPIGHYIAYFSECSSGVTHGYNEHQVYQRENCLFGNGELKLVSEYKGNPDTLPMQCGDYDLPPNKICDPNHQTLFYTSGCLQTTTKFLYGYFEVRCSLPTHKGSFPAFWLFDANSNFYNEIDIFEYSNGSDPSRTYKQYNCAILSNNYSNSDPKYMSSATPVLPDGSSTLRDFHVFACEWLPDRVTWFVDGYKVFEDLNNVNIPHHHMFLKLNYAIDNYAVPYQTNTPNWFNSDEMIVDYVKVYQLKTDCDDDVLISNVQDLDSFQPSVKHSISIVPSGELIVPTDTDVTMRAESITISNGFTLPQGAKITMRTQICPE